MDNGSFEIPTVKFTGMIHVNEFSLKLSGRNLLPRSRQEKKWLESMSKPLMSIMTMC